MRDRKIAALRAVLVGQAGCELLSTFVPPTAPIAIGGIFGLIFLGTAFLVHRGRLAGLVLGALLGLFLLTQYPTWPKHNALEWFLESIAGALALAALVLSCVALVKRMAAARRLESTERA
jgi:hypothetical protein